MREMIDLLIRSKVPVLIIGGHAVGLHGLQRDTIDLDCLVAAEHRDELKAYLEGRGFEETGRHTFFSRYRHQSLVYPLLDVMQVDAQTWAELWAGSVAKTLNDLPVRVPAILHLFALKLHAIQQDPTREFQDGSDISRLLQANPGLIPAADLQRLFDRYQLGSLLARMQGTL
jgi:hypothetical protein